MTVWTPPQGWTERTNVWRFMRRLGFTRLDDFLRFSRDENERFWDEMVRETGIEWFQPYRRVLDASDGPQWARWFEGGRLNIAHNCLDRHAASDHAAILWEAEDGAARTVSFRELARQTAQLANALHGLGLRAGDRVALAMPMIPEVVTVLYACFKLGLVAVPVFAGFGADAIATRVEDAGARVVITADWLARRGRRLPLKDKLAGVAAERVIVYRYKGDPVSWDARRDVWWDELLAGQPEECPSAALDSEARALILYTSGTTGKPKGAVHTHAGALVQTTKEIWLAFDHQPQDRFFWLSDIGWMMGAWEIIGNHHFGGTVFLYDGAPDYPEPDRLWSVIERHRITALGISPTAIRMLMRCGAGPLERHDLSSLRLLGSTGEPWDEESYLWYFEHGGGRRCPVINISGGTEILGCFLMPMPIQPLEPCTLGGPAPGMAVSIFDEHGQPVPRGVTGHLVCTKPAPSMTRGIWDDPERYLASYWGRWPGVWTHGDWASVDEQGHWFLHGRADEAMNIAGRKVGPAEVEDALTRHPSVSEAAVIGVPDALTGEAIVAFVVPSSGAQIDAAALCAHVAETLGAPFRPKAIVPVAELPKTQSGKVVRRLMRQHYLGEATGDESAVQNPAALAAIPGAQAARGT